MAQESHLGQRLIWLSPGALAIGLLLLLIAGAVGGLISQAPALDFPAALADPSLRRITLFTLWQAALSTLLSVGLAIPVARALARRRRFWGRTWLLRIFSLSLVMPTIVAILGVVAVHGRHGWVNQALEVVGLTGGNYLYGLNGILIAHVFFNMPLASRILLQALEAIPPENWRLARQLGMGPWAVFRWIDWPVMRQAIPSAAGLIFMLCFTSFAVVLTLGGGPRSTTLEVAIYQSLRLEFDLGKAVILAGLQVALCLLFALCLLRAGKAVAMEKTEQRYFPRPDSQAWPSRLLDGIAIAAAVTIVVVPLLAVVVSAVNDKALTVLADPRLWQATAQSLTIAFSAGGLALLLGGGILATSRALQFRLGWSGVAPVLEVAGSLILVVPPFVMATGLFVLLRGFTDVFAIGFYLVILVNALMALPFVLRILGGTVLRHGEQSERLCQSLGITGWQRWRLIDWPVLRRPCGLALAIGATLSLGDLSVIALFGTQDFTTLPLLIYQLMGSYRMAEAAVTAGFLAVLCLCLFVLLERLFAGRDRTGRQRPEL